MKKFFGWAAVGVAALALTLATPTASKAQNVFFAADALCAGNLASHHRGGHSYCTPSCRVVSSCYSRSYCYSACPAPVCYTPCQPTCYPRTRWYRSCGYTYSVPVCAVPTNVATINVAVPPNARVWFFDDETKQTGCERVFQSPPLSPGHDFTYEIKAQWCGQDGKEVIRTQCVKVRANGSVNVDFTQSAE